MKNKKIKNGRVGYMWVCVDSFVDWYISNHNRNNKYNKVSLEYLESLPNYKNGIVQMMLDENERRSLKKLEVGRKRNDASHSHIKCPKCGTIGSSTNIKRSHFEKCKYPIIKEYIESCLPDEEEFSITELINNLKEKTGLSHSVIKRNLVSFFLVKGSKSPVKGSSSNISYQKWKYEPAT